MNASWNYNILASIHHSMQKANNSTTYFPKWQQVSWNKKENMYRWHYKMFFYSLPYKDHFAGDQARNARNVGLCHQ